MAEKLIRASQVDLSGIEDSLELLQNQVESEQEALTQEILERKNADDEIKVDISDLEQGLSDLEESKQNKLIAGPNIFINPETNVISASGGLSEVSWGNIKGTLSNQTDLQKELDDINDKIEEIELFKFPNAIIIGEPTIQNGQVSDFSTVSYLQFPFILDLHEKAFQIDMCFTTATNVQTQQNILDSKFGLALAIQNGKGVMAISSNGTNWDIGSVVGTQTLQSNTTYYARLIWNRLQYKTQLSTDGVNYVDDMVIVDTRRPFPTTIFIGGCDMVETGHTGHPFLGSINLNKCSLSVMGSVIWQGMDDAGLATRADISLDNLDAAGQAKFDAKQDTLVSGTNIKTINNESILGEGNIEIKGGGGASYDWIGTLEQYNAAKDAGEIDPNWLCMITDDVVEDNYMPAFTDLGRVVWNELLPSASENVKGVVRIATEEETKEATREDLAVNPKNLNTLINTKVQTGKIVGMPDWENAQTLTVGETYTWDGGAGYILQVAHVMKTSWYMLNLNGLDLIMQYAVDYDWDSSASTNLIPIKNGDVFKLTYHDGGHGGTSLRYYCFLPILTEEN